MKILIIRLSSIGDVVLTSPVVRCIKQQMPDAEIHFLTRQSYVPLVECSPYIDKVVVYSSSRLAERYDCIVDLQRNFRSWGIRMANRGRCRTFPKENLSKLLYVLFKRPPKIRHVVDRYFDAVKPLGVKNDGLGLDFFYSEDEERRHLPTEVGSLLPQGGTAEPYVVFVVGAQHLTKAIPLGILGSLVHETRSKVVLLGGRTDDERIKASVVRFGNNTVNLCGRTTLAQSALIMKHAALVVTPDTGMMHIATAMGCRIVVVWGSTTPQIGFSPYLPQDCQSDRVVNMEVGLPCRPCSKLGRDKCPKGHRNCMRRQPWHELVETLSSITDNGQAGVNS